MSNYTLSAINPYIGKVWNYISSCCCCLVARLHALLEQITFVAVGVTTGWIMLMVVRQAPSLGHYILAGLGGIILLKLAHHYVWGDTLLAKVFKFSVAVVIGNWCTYSLANFAFFEDYYRPTMEEFLNTTPAMSFALKMGGFESWEQAMQDKKMRRKAENQYAQWIRQLGDWEAYKKKGIDSLPHFDRVPLYGNHYVSMLSDAVANKVSRHEGIERWINGPTSQWSYSNLNVRRRHPRQLKFRMLGHTILMFVLLATSILLRFMLPSTSESFKSKTLSERLASYEGIIRLLFLAAYAAGATAISYYMPFIGGPPEALYPIIAAPPFALLVWLMLLKD